MDKLRNMNSIMYATTKMLAYSKNGDLNKLKSLCKKYKITSEDIKYNNYAVLVNSCCFGHLNIVKFLTETYNIHDLSANNYIALKYAYRHISIVKYLITMYKISIDTIRVNFILEFYCNNRAGLDVISYICNCGLDKDDVVINDALRISLLKRNVEVVLFLCEQYNMYEENVVCTLYEIFDDSDIEY